MSDKLLKATVAATPSVGATPPVTHPRLRRLSISGFRAFPAYKPTSFELDLGADGKNLLLYGENGSGKTSLFRALRDLFDTSPQPRSYADHQNIFSQAEDDAISAELTAGIPSEYRWEIGEKHPKETGGDPFQAFARSCLFLDYRDLLETSFVHRVGSPNLFSLLVGTILAELPVPSRKLSEIHQSMLNAKPARQTKRPVRRAISAAAALSEVLTNHLPEVVVEGNRLLERLQKSTQFALTPRAITYSTTSRAFQDRTIALTVTYNGREVTEPQHLLNEARLTALALALYLAAARIIRSGRPGIMVLDDVLIGLDLSNRIPLLALLREEFAEWQVLLLTYDHTWYELARDYTGDWLHKEMYLLGNQDGQPPIPEIKDGVAALERAKAHLAAHDLTAAAVYLRAAFEGRLRNVCERWGVEVPFKKQLKEVKADALWKGIVKRQEVRKELQAREPAKNHPDFIPQALIDRVAMMRSTILNRLSHTDSPNFGRSEVETTRDIVEELQRHQFPPAVM